MNVSKILFFADTGAQEQAGLNRAVQIANHFEAAIEVVDVVGEIADEKVINGVESVRDKIVRNRRDELDKLIANLPTCEGRKPFVTRRILVGEDYVEVIRLVQKESFDLLVKEPSAARSIRTTLFGSADKRLIHNCPCPVMILKPSAGLGLGSILAAVDPKPRDSVHMQLNNAIMDAGVRVSKLEHARLHILHAWDVALEERHHAAGDDFADLVQSIRSDTARRLKQLTVQYDNVEDHLERGDPETAIAEFVAANAIDLLIMGTVSRTGIPGFLVGNTAEKILDVIDCSVLALKPAGWKSLIA